jgi:adenosylcobinamide-phosphate synthase
MELILFSYLADLVFGDPQWFPHPVRLMGRLIAFFERRLNARGDKLRQRLYGTTLALGVIACSAISASLLIGLAQKLHPLAGKIAWVFLAYTSLATGDLIVHARAVWKPLSLNNIEGTRQSLSLMVGRDTQKLSQDELICAAVETIAESTTDGIIAPLFYLFLGGPVLALSFKAVSTLDSMLGHKEERYLHFGWCAAKLDTLANFIPARITGLLIPLAAFFCAKDFRESFRIMLRDGRKQDSLNSAVSEAAMAGALGIQLGGVCSYAARRVEHPYLGEVKNPLSWQLIRAAALIAVFSSVLMLGIGLITRQAVLYLLGL